MQSVASAMSKAATGSTQRFCGISRSRVGGVLDSVSIGVIFHSGKPFGFEAKLMPNPTSIPIGPWSYEQPAGKLAVESLLKTMSFVSFANFRMIETDAEIKLFGWLRGFVLVENRAPLPQDRLTSDELADH